uniref:NADH-ubiquinone oxidoreductase chain 5 n=1 Tax=Trachelipus rathkii TaxID=1720764 RepID=A0A0G2T4K6_9CRUS|nr:NADH dehydrogenase subunit 5 [Trachelipus rathkii]ASN74424.1 NADH dehydrogenase subunit 5 [Trachelipus rathkii]
MVFMLLSMIFGLDLMVSGKSYVLEWGILSSGSVSMLFNFYIDWMSVIFFGFIALISSSIFFYSGSYMKASLNFRLFMMLVFMFVVSMFFLVFSLNLVSMMLGWDGLGVTSYILVIFYKNEKSGSAGMVTALSNRVGDAALLLSIACLVELGSWSYMFMLMNKGELVMWLVSLAAITKSAQIPFSAWLPAAMAAPTPVSALVHSSTLVTAGVYLLIRFESLLMGSKIMNFLIYLGLMTTLMASLSALVEVDFKKVVALSTLSQLGIMVSTLSMGFSQLAFVHLLIHAVFKALLFMCSGKIIHSMNDSQDIRKMGGMIFNLPITGMVMNLSSLALCGVPFLSGFYSKDLIIESMMMTDNFLMFYSFLMMVVGLSASYSFRLMFLSFNIFSNQALVSSSEEKDWVMLSSKIGLMTMSLISGAILLWVVMPIPVMVSLSMNLKWLAFVSMILGVFIGLMWSVSNLKSLVLMKGLAQVDMYLLMWNMSKLSGNKLSHTGQSISLLIKKMDFGWSEAFGGQGLNFFFLKSSEVLSLWLINSLKKNLLVMIMMLVVIMTNIW